jgi:hypothetical protein
MCYVFHIRRIEARARGAQRGRNEWLEGTETFCPQPETRASDFLFESAVTH